MSANGHPEVTIPAIALPSGTPVRIDSLPNGERRVTLGPFPIALVLTLDRDSTRAIASALSGIEIASEVPPKK